MGKDTKTGFRYVDEVPGSLASGKPVEPGEYAELTEDEINDEFNADLIARGRLIEVDPALIKQAERAQREAEKEAQQSEEAIEQAIQEDK